MQQFNAFYQSYPFYDFKINFYVQLLKLTFDCKCSTFPICNAISYSKPILVVVVVVVVVLVVVLVLVLVLIFFIFISFKLPYIIVV